MPTTPKTRKIISNFSKSENKEKQEKWTLDELLEAVADSPDNDYYRPPITKINNRIDDLKKEGEKTEQRSHDNYLRLEGAIIAIIVGLIIAGLSKYFFG